MLHCTQLLVAQELGLVYSSPVPRLISSSTRIGSFLYKKEPRYEATCTLELALSLSAWKSRLKVMESWVGAGNRAALGLDYRFTRQLYCYWLVVNTGLLQAKELWSYIGHGRNSVLYYSAVCVVS